jgi:hypothetical protein
MGRNVTLSSSYEQKADFYTITFLKLYDVYFSLNYLTREESMKSAI